MGLRETQDVLNRLDAILANEVFREIGQLSRFPAGNQVLQKREGYREIFRAYVQFEAAAKLSWEGGDEVYGAGQRDVAALFEYWVFYQRRKTTLNITKSCPGWEHFRCGPPKTLRARVLFIDKVIDHVATQTSQHERARYWARESYQDDTVPSSRDAASFLERPPADTRVLLGYVKNKMHRTWIRQEALYNITFGPTRSAQAV